MDFAHGRWVVEEHHLDLRTDQLLLFQVLAKHLETLLQLQGSRWSGIEGARMRQRIHVTGYGLRVLTLAGHAE